MSKLHIVAGHCDNKLRRIERIVLVLCILVSCSTVAIAQQQNWVGTWASWPMQLSPKINKTFVLGEQELTIREVVHVTQGGKYVRVTLTNEFGDDSLAITSARLAKIPVSRVIFYRDTTMVATFLPMMLDTQLWQTPSPDLFQEIAH